MGIYQFLMLDRSGQIRGVEVFECEDDGEARIIADGLLEKSSHRTVDVFEAGSHVCRVSQSHGA